METCFSRRARRSLNLPFRWRNWLTQCVSSEAKKAKRLQPSASLPRSSVLCLTSRRSSTEVTIGAAWTTQPDFVSALGDALTQIVGQVLSCTFNVPEPPVDFFINPDDVTVEYAPGDGNAVHLIPRPDGTGTCTGWQYVQYVPGSDYTQMELCGTTCDTVLSDPGATVTVHFGCVLPE